jgi:hypothetical protein
VWFSYADRAVQVSRSRGLVLETVAESTPATLLVGGRDLDIYRGRSPRYPAGERTRCYRAPLTAIRGERVKHEQPCLIPSPRHCPVRLNCGNAEDPPRQLTGYGAYPRSLMEGQLWLHTMEWSASTSRL